MRRTNTEIRVLIADDHPMVREGLQSMLRAQTDITVIGVANTGSEAVTKTQVLAPDVVLMDIRMPDMDGLTALAEINAKCPTTKVIVVTTYDKPAYLLQAVANGAAGFVLKGISSADLAESIRRVMHGELLIDRLFLANVLQSLSCEDATLTRIDHMLGQSLTDREREVLCLVTEGLENQQIASLLSITAGTVKTHVQHILEKLHASNRTQAAVIAVRLGFVE